MNLDDKSLFLGAMEDVQPLKRHNDVHWHPERKTRAVQRVDNLLRQPVEKCRQMLFAFVVQARKEGLRNVLIVHGKGRDDNAHANIIRSYLARWLAELPEVQAFCAALPHHGGSGACYVALRKSAEAKQENWERHAKHSR